MQRGKPYLGKSGRRKASAIEASFRGIMAQEEVDVVRGQGSKSKVNVASIDYTRGPAKFANHILYN